MPAISGAVDHSFSCDYTASGTCTSLRRGGVSAILLYHTVPPSGADMLLDGYRRHGVKAIHERTLDCAVVLHDRDQRRLVLSRDALGLHPLHYRRTAQRFAFASRIADVLRMSHATTRPHRAALARWLLQSLPPEADQTFFDDVFSVPPAATLVLEEDRLRHLPPRDWSHSVNVPISSFRDAARHFAEHFEHAVRTRLDSGVRSAVLVSGGLDSAAIMSCTTGTRAFGVTYGLHDGSPADESRYVDALRAQGHDIHEVAFAPTTSLAAIERCVHAFEKPVADDVPLTLERAAGCAREQGATVILLGTWGDQVLAPFPPPHLRSLPPWRLLKLNRAARSLQQSMTDVPPHKIRRALIRASLRRRVPARMRALPHQPPRAAGTFDLLSAENSLNEQADPVTYAQALHASVADRFHIDAVENTAKWGLANELEVRLPFLDTNLLRFLLQVPDRYAYHELQLKPLLRSGMRGTVPDMILERTDKGDYTAAIQARAPQTSTLLEPLDRLVRLVDYGLMSARTASRTLAKLTAARNITSETAALAGNLLAVDAWLRIFFEGQT